MKKENFQGSFYDMLNSDNDHSNSVATTDSTVTEVATGQDGTSDFGIPYVKAPVYGDTYLASGAVVEGNIKTKGNIEIASIYTGDVESEETVTIHSEFNGNITAKNVSLLESKMTGDIVSENLVVINEKSVLSGNITAGSVECFGKVTGNIISKGVIKLRSQSVVRGDIETALLVTDEGAKVAGKISMKFDD